MQKQNLNVTITLLLSPQACISKTLFGIRNLATLRARETAQNPHFKTPKKEHKKQHALVIRTSRWL